MSSVVSMLLKLIWKNTNWKFEQYSDKCHETSTDHVAEHVVQSNHIGAPWWGTWIIMNQNIFFNLSTPSVHILHKSSQDTGLEGHPIIIWLLLLVRWGLPAHDMGKASQEIVSWPSGQKGRWCGEGDINWYKLYEWCSGCWPSTFMTLVGSCCW